MVEYLIYFRAEALLLVDRRECVAAERVEQKFHACGLQCRAEKAREEATLADKLCDVTLGYLLACEE